MAEIPADRVDLLERPIVATIATILPDGQPQVTPVWADYDGTHVLVVTRKETRKYRNVRNDPRVTVTTMDPDDNYRYLEVRGTVEKLPEDGALAFSDRQAQHYWGVDEYPFARDEPRALLHIRPDRVVAPDVGSPEPEPTEG